MRISQRLPVVATVVAVALGLSACSGGDDGADAPRAKPTNCTNKIVHEDANRVSV